MKDIKIPATMDKFIDISFNGVTNSMPDDSCAPGDVSMAFGLTSEAYVSTALQPKQTHLYGIDGCDILLVHKGNGYENVFIYDPADAMTRAYRLADLLDEDTGKDCLCETEGKPVSTAVIGNVVVLCFDGQTRYAYRKADSYTVRDNKLPPVQIQIVAACRTVAQLQDDNGTYVVGAASYPDGLYPIRMEWQLTGFSTTDLVKQGEAQQRKDENSMEKGIMAEFNAIVAEWGRYGYLFSPVIVRAAYRLKSGGMAGLTNPVLCFPFDEPMIAASEIEDDRWMFRAVGYKLYAKFLKVADMDAWDDIVDSIEVYMSAPIYTHSTDGTDIRWYESSSIDFHGFKGFFGRTPRKVIVPGKTDNLSYKKLEEVSTFYKVCSLPFTNKELYKSIYDMEDTSREDYTRELYMDRSATKTFANFMNGYRKLLTNIDGRDMDVTSDALAALPVMDDDVLRSNIPSAPLGVASYNARLIAIGNSYDLSQLPDQSFFSHCVVLCSLTSCSGSWEKLPLSGLVAISEDTVTGISCVFDPNIYNNKGLPKYITCEEPNLKKVMAVETTSDDTGATQLRLATLKFKQHDLLNLSIFTGQIEYVPCYYGDVTSLQYEKYLELRRQLDSGTANHTVTRDDYIRESNVADPYTFDDSNNAYFNSRVTDILVVPEAITLGQYGADQLYAVCEDGIYTVSVDAEGKLQSVHTYVNDSTAGGWSGCIAKTRLFFNNGQAWGYYSGQKEEVFLPLSRNLAFHYDDLPHLVKLQGLQNWLEMLAGNSLFDFLASCKLHYDAANAMIVGTVSDGNCVAVWRNGYGLHLLPCKASYAVASGKLLLADDQQNIYDFSESTLQDVADGVIVTRPIHLGETPVSTVRTVVARGNFDRRNVGIVLYGTRDYVNWHYVASSSTYYLTNITGTPYKAYKVVLQARLGRDEYVSRLTFRYVEKMAGRIAY